jgi:RNA polymerase sigma-70 factor (ECF subfamily)
MVKPRGDRTDFEEFFNSTKDQIFRAVLVSIRDRRLAEDAVSEGFTRALATWPRVARHPSPVAWVAKAALNYARSDRRRQLRSVPVELPEIAVWDEAPTDPGLVLRVLNLPDRQRQVVALRILLDLSTEQTAELLSIAPSTVTVHLLRALARLESELSEFSTKEGWI